MRPWLAFCLLLSLPAWAQDFQRGDLRVVQPWSRAMPVASANGAAYLELDNQGKQADRLLSASTPRAARAELHGHINDNGVMRMREVKGGVEIPAGGQLRFAPGGLHVMLMGLKSPLAAGERFPLTLKFERAGELTVEVAVRKE